MKYVLLSITAFTKILRLETSFLHLKEPVLEKRISNNSENINKSK